jgi:hypothetical protein
MTRWPISVRLCPATNRGDLGPEQFENYLAGISSIGALGEAGEGRQFCRPRRTKVPPAAYVVGTLRLPERAAIKLGFRERATSGTGHLALDHLHIRWTYPGHNVSGA